MSTSRTNTETPTSLPLWIAAACLVTGLCLFFGNTIPALREGEGLTKVEQDLDGDNRSYALAIRKAHLSGAGADIGDIDLQSLFVAIDEQGYTITEFCEVFPVEDGQSEDPRNRPGRSNR